MKYFYKGLALFALFCISLFWFGKSIPDLNTGTATATILQDSTFPIVSLQLGSYTVNTLHGYSSNLDSAIVRGSITPLDPSKSFEVLISENEQEIKKLDYELQDIRSHSVIGSDSHSALSGGKHSKSIQLKLDAEMEPSTEYGLTITLTTSLSKKIYYFTRIKYYDNDFFLKEKLNFVKDFHDATFGKKNDISINDYLETSGDHDSTFANVSIYSSKKMVTWGKLKPEIITDCVPVIKELNIETAAIEQTYFVHATTDIDRELYRVKEFYRVRYSGGRIYLLYFQRTMDAIFDPDLISTSKSEFKLGITNTEKLHALASDHNKKFTFTVGGDLWYYDLKAKKLNQVFSFVQNSKDYLRDYYDQHDIRILNMDDDGNIDFVVYGYMNCGDYEGRVGILLYRYSPKDNHITERIYLPLDTTYQRLKEDFGSFCYVNKKDIFYFSLYGRIYSYNITSRQHELLAGNNNGNNVAMLENAKCFVWSNATKQHEATEITILNLDNEKKITLKAKPGQYIKVLGAIDSSIVYGYIRKGDVYRSTEGETISPAYCVVIADNLGRTVKKYAIKNVYITKTTVADDIIYLKRIRKSGGRFRRISDDSIQHQQPQPDKSFQLTSRVTDRTLTEKYIALPAGYLMENKPDTSSTKYVMVTENTTFHLSNPTKNLPPKYYIYAYGQITGATDQAGDAILQADEQMGVVMDNQNHIIWERGGKFNSKTLSLMDKTMASSAEGVSSIKACVQMLLQNAQVTVSARDLKGYSAMDMMNRRLDNAVNLTGCTLDEVLYFVSSGKPVIGMRNDTQAVIITAYTLTTVEWYDPTENRMRKMSLSSAERLFKDAGYVFFSYI